ncbi:hypothetical protein CTH_0447 [Carboxydocella thermautotrophica]|nr:hypothetical protein CTH_0447 [Carboxydocella thermautotrophica]
MKLQQLLEQLQTDGVWCLAVLPLYRDRKSYTTSLPRYSLVQKYLRLGEKIVVVSLKQYDVDWSYMIGIEAFPLTGIEFSETDGKIIIKRDYIEVEKILRGEEYLQDAGVFLVKEQDFTLRYRRYRPGPQYKVDMVATGFLTAEEFDYYNQDRVAEKLPQIDLCDIHRYLPARDADPEICAWCQCPREKQETLWNCPLLGNRQICQTCCYYDSQSMDIYLRVPEILEVARFLTDQNLTLEEAIKICQNCGKGGLQNWNRKQKL